MKRILQESVTKRVPVEGRLTAEMAPQLSELVKEYVDNLAPIVIPACGFITAGCGFIMGVGGFTHDSVNAGLDHKNQRSAQRTLDQAVDSATDKVTRLAKAHLQKKREENPNLSVEESKLLVQNFLDVRDNIFPAYVRVELSKMPSRHTSLEKRGRYREDISPVQAVMKYLFDEKVEMFDWEMIAKGYNRLEALAPQIVEQEFALRTFSSAEAAQQAEDWQIHQSARRGSAPDVMQPVEAIAAPQNITRRGSGPPVLQHSQAADTTAAARNHLSAGRAPEAAPAANAPTQASDTAGSGISSVLESNVYSLEYMFFLFSLCCHKLTYGTILVCICVKLAFMLKTCVCVAVMACIAHEIWPHHMQTNWSTCSTTYSRVRIGLLFLSIMPWIVSWCGA